MEDYINTTLEWRIKNSLRINKSERKGYYIHMQRKRCNILLQSWLWMFITSTGKLVSWSNSRLQITLPLQNSERILSNNQDSWYHFKNNRNKFSYQNVLLLIFATLCQLQLGYAWVFWDFVSEMDFATLDRVQHKMVCVFLSAYRWRKLQSCCCSR